MTIEMQYLHGIRDHGRTNCYLFLDKVIFFLYVMYFVLRPFYFWSSGLPQIADLVLLLIFALYSVRSNLKFRLAHKTNLFILSGFVFVSYVTCVNLVGMTIMNSPAILAQSFFYLFNFLAALMTVLIYGHYKGDLLKLTNKALVLSVFIQIGLFFVTGGFTGARSTISFNNPNQLGRYALMTACFQIHLSGKVPISSTSLVLGLGSCAILVIVSLSVGAIVSYFVLVGLSLLISLVKSQGKRQVAAFVICLFLVVVFICIETLSIYEIKGESTVMESLANRAQAAQEKARRMVTERGYDRIVRYPEYLVFGAAEGEYASRFGETKELHSTLGNILVSYGIIGLFLFSTFVYLALKNDNFKSWHIVFAVVLIYGLVHNGIRDTMLWIFLALVSLGPLDKSGS